MVIVVMVIVMDDDNYINVGEKSMDIGSHDVMGLTNGQDGTGWQ